LEVDEALARDDAPVATSAVRATAWFDPAATEVKP
jgi:hypothetical protein